MSDFESKINCAVIPGDYRTLYRFKYWFNQHIVQSVPGTGEVETVGYQGALAYYDVVATTEELARAAYQLEFGSRAKNEKEHKLISGPEFICYVDAVVDIAGGRAR